MQRYSGLSGDAFRLMATLANRCGKVGSNKRPAIPNAHHVKSESLGRLSLRLSQTSQVSEILTYCHQIGESADSQ